MERWTKLWKRDPACVFKATWESDTECSKCCDRQPQPPVVIFLVWKTVKNITSYLWNVTSAPEFVFFYCEKLFLCEPDRWGGLCIRSCGTSNFWTETVTLNAGLTFSSICLTGTTIHGTYLLFNTQFGPHTFNSSHDDRLHGMLLSHFTKCSWKQKQLLHPARQSLSTFQLNLSKAFQHFKVYKENQSLVLLCFIVAVHVQTFPLSTNKTGSSVLLFGVWPPLHQRHLSLFRSAAIHLLSGASGRLHPCSPTKTSEVWSAFVHELKVSMKPLRSTEISHWGIFSPDSIELLSANAK